MGDDERILFRGRRVLPDWPERLEAAQQATTYSIGGSAFPRIAYGSEPDDWGAESRPCHDCAAVAGELHVPGCDVERCPSCGDQAIGCDYEHDE
jgi:hypothetical protein